MNHPLEQGRNDDRVMRRTQSIIAIVRIAFALVVGVGVLVVWVGGSYSDDEYQVPGTEWTYPLWHAFAIALMVLAIVFIGGIGELARARRGRRFSR